MENKKPNDIFVALLQKPDLNVIDLTQSNFVPDNTQLLSLEDYKQSNNVIKAFTSEDGKLNTEALDNAYLKAISLYNELGNDKVLANALTWDPYDFTAPINSKKTNVSTKITKDINPYKNLYGRTGINSIDTNDLSLRELAQQSKIFDTTENKWLDESANDLGLFGSLFGKTLVYAQWDKDSDGTDIDPLTGRVSNHKKGDWKYDENGNLYIETLGDREIYGKQIVNPTDLITNEDSWFNKVDFFDSDGRDKSVAGTTMKLAAEIAPFLIPGFNVYYGGFKMAMGLSYVLPTFYKAGEGLFFGEIEAGNETELWKAMNKMQGTLAKYNTSSKSDYAQQSMFNYEQLGGLVSDVFGQIYEQRAAASLSKIFYKSNETEYLAKLSDKVNKSLTNAALSGKIKSVEQAEKLAKSAYQKIASVSEADKKRSALAKSLSLGYMAMTQSADVYGDAIASGYDNRTAGFAALLAASGQYTLMMNNRLGDWFLDKTTGYTTEASRAGIRRATNELLEEIQEGVSKLEVNKVVGKKSLGEVFKKAKNKFNNLILNPRNISEAELRENLFKHGVIEGVEEVTEEVAIDASKAIVDVMGALGFTAKQGSFGGLSNVFSQQGLERYVSSLVGGAIGGQMFEIERSVISPIITGQKLNLESEYNLLQLIANGKTNQLLSEIDKQKSSYGSTELSPVVTKIGDQDFYLTSDKLSQADIIANVAKEKIKHIDKMLNLENIKEDDESVIRKAIMDEIKIQDMIEHGTDKFIISDFTQLANDLIHLRHQTDAAKDDQSELGKVSSSLNKKRLEMEDLLSGKKSEYYHGLHLFSLAKNLHSAFINMSVSDWVSEKYNEDYYSLSEDKQKEYKEKFDIVMDLSKDNFKNRMKTMYDQFLIKNEEISKSINDYDKDGYALLRSRFISTLKNKPESLDLTNLYQDYIKLHEINSTLISGGYRNQSLSSNIDPSFGRFLIDSGIIELGMSQEDIINETKITLDKVATELGINKEEGENDEEYYNKVNKLGELAISSGNEVIKNLYTERINTIENNRKEISETEKEAVITHIDSIGIPTGEIDLITLQNLLDINKKGKSSEIKLLSPSINEENLEESLKQLQESGTIIQQLSKNFTLKVKGISKKAIFKEVAYQTKLGNISNQIKDFITSINEILESEIDPLTKFNEINNIIDNFYYDEDFAVEIGNLFTDFNSMPSSEQLLKITENYLNKLIDNVNTNINENMFDNSQLIPFNSDIHNEENSFIFITNNKEINPRRELLIKYGEQVVNSKEDLDEETIIELNKEVDKIKLKISNHPISATVPDIDNVLFEEDSEVYQLLAKLGYNDYLRIKNILVYQNKKINTFLRKLNEIQISLYGKETPISIFKLLENNINEFEKLTSPAEFTRNDIQLEQLQKALYTLNTVKSVISAMLTTSVDNSYSPESLYGYNVNLNKAAEKEGIKGKFGVISSETAFMLKKDVEQIEKKIKYLKVLAEANSGSLIEEQGKIQEALINSLYSAITSQEKTSLTNITLNGKPLINQDDLDKIKDLPTKEQQLIELESLVYNKFHEDTSRSLEEKLNEIFSAFLEDGQNNVENILYSKDSDLTKTLSKLEKKDWYFYLHSILALDSKDFYNNYKNLLEIELPLENAKAPFFTQQFILRQELGYINKEEGKQIMAHSIKFLQPEVNELVKEIMANENNTLTLEEATKQASEKLKSFSIPYIFSLKGSAGTGKSTILGNFLLRIATNTGIPSPTVSMIASAPTTSTLDTLKKSIKSNVNGTINEFLITDFIKESLTKEAYSELLSEIELIKEEKFNELKKSVRGIGTGAVILKEDWLNTAFIDHSGNNTHIIIIDEMTKLNTLEWQILNYLAKHNNYYIITLGDPLQNGIFLGKESFSYDNIMTPSSVKLKSTIRSANIHANENNIGLERWVSMVKEKSKNQNAQEPISVNLHYYQELYLNGHKFIDNLTVDELKKLDPTKEILFITEDGKLSDSQKADITLAGINKYEISKPEVQGREFDQVVILSNIEKENLYDSARNLYTLLTRAKIATLIVNNNSIMKSAKLTQQEAKYTKEKFINQSDIKSYLEKRLEQLRDFTKTFEQKPTNKEKEEEKQTPLDVDYTPDIEDPITKHTVFDSNTISDKKDPNKIIGYTFFNNIGFIDNEDWIGKNKNKIFGENITFDEFKTFVKDNTTTTDLGKLIDQIPPYTIVGKSVKEVLSEYVAFKNNLLFSFIDKSIDRPKFFEQNLEFDQNGLVARTLKPNEYSQSYGKIANNNPITTNIHTLGIWSGDTYITLAVLPDISTAINKTANTKNAVDIENLKNLYDILDNDREQIETKIYIRSENIEVYGGVHAPKMNPLENPISAEELSTMFPGSTISEIKVFRGGKYIGDKLVTESTIDFMKTEIDKYLPEGFPKEKLTNAYYKKLMFRPFVVVSFVKNKVKYSRIVVLSPKSRKLSKVWEEFQIADNLLIDSKNNIEKEDFSRLVQIKKASLISKYEGWKIIYDFLTFCKRENLEAKRISDIIRGFEGFKAYSFKEEWSNIPWDNTLEKLTEFALGDNDIAFERIYNQGSLKEILGDRLQSFPPIKIINPLYVIKRLIDANIKQENSDYQKVQDAFSEFIKNYNENIYYNTIIDSAKEDVAGEFGLLPVELLNNYQLSYVLESNKLRINMNNLMKSIKIEPVQEEIKTLDSNDIFNSNSDKIEPKLTVVLSSNKKVIINLPKVKAESGMKISDYDFTEYKKLQGSISTALLESDLVNDLPDGIINLNDLNNVTDEYALEFLTELNKEIRSLSESKGPKIEGKKQQIIIKGRMTMLVKEASIPNQYSCVFN